MKALKQKRSTLRSSFTRSANSLDTLLTAAQPNSADIEKGTRSGCATFHRSRYEIQTNIEHQCFDQVYIWDLLQLVMAKNKSDLTSLYDKLQTRIRALDSLVLTKDKYAEILFLHLSTDKNQGKTDLDLLMEFTKNEVDSEFSVKIAREIFHHDKVNNKKNVNQYFESKAVASTACELLTANDNSKSPP
ncbi:uncharacterized protein TNCV_3178881 [Trichonephila clavipes]|nr:uncharacterized protein TNCV_3178881 [Trichonephila clavipes]